MANCKTVVDFVISRIINVAWSRSKFRPKEILQAHVRGSILFSRSRILKIYNLGDVVYLPLVKGTVLPNGDIHDGYFIVRDAGGAINGHGRFDFFTGFFTTKHPENSFTKIKLNGLQIFPEYFLVDGAEAESSQRAKFPSVAKSRKA